MSTQQSRRTEALGIVLKCLSLDYAGTVEKRVASMTFGKVVRQTLQLNAAGPSSLALCCKRLHQDGKRHDRTYRLLALRLAATYGKAADLEGYPHLRYPTLRDGQRLLDRIEDRHSDGTTALIRAITYRKLDQAHALIAAGAHVNATNVGDSAMALAAAGGLEGTVKVLHRAGADLNYCRISGKTPLTLAVANRRSGIVAYLVTAKADVNKRDGTGDTPLLLAILLQDAGITELLLKAGADRQLRTIYGLTPLKLINKCPDTAGAKPRIIELLTS